MQPIGTSTRSGSIGRYDWFSLIFPHIQAQILELIDER